MSLAGRSATLRSAEAPEDCDDAAWAARQMVLDAGAQAARLRRQASAQAATVCAAAERETEKIWRLASAQAASVREAAEREAAELRATVIRLSAIDGGVASHEAARLLGTPGTRIVGKPGAEPGAEPGTRRAAKPGARLARRPQRPPRQLVAARVAVTATAAMLLFAVSTGTTELALHGFRFFVFRSAGTGETGPTAPSDQQFLAQEAAAAKAASRPITARPGSTRHGHRNERLIARNVTKGNRGG
jgi:hypothetical protein